jgi:hypothetical protein
MHRKYNSFAATKPRHSKSLEVRPAPPLRIQIVTGNGTGLEPAGLLKILPMKLSFCSQAPARYSFGWNSFKVEFTSD